MPTFRHGTEVRCYVHDLDMSQYAEEVGLDLARDLAEIKPLAGGQVSRVPGWRDVTLTLSAAYEAATADERAFDQLDTATQGCFAVLFDGDTAGNAAYLGLVLVASETVDAGDAAVKMPVKAFGTADLDRGISLHPLTERTSDASTTARDDRPAGTSSVGAQAYLNVTAISAAAATLTVKIEHSTNNSDWADLLTFTNVTSAGGTTSEKKATAADADVYRYVKVTWTITALKAATFFVGWKRN
jgi:hypothetical protein